MAATARSDAELKKKCKAIIADKNSTLLEKFRAQCLMRGASGIKELGRTFRIIDDDRSGSLEKSEFHKCVKDFGLTQFDTKQIDELFSEFDKDNSGSIDYEEFLVKMRPPLNNRRLDLIHRAFAKLDYDKSGEVTKEDLEGVYDVSKHPKFMSGEWSADRVFEEFLKTFEAEGDTDGTVTREEFMAYYAGVSASIDSDAYFELMMNNAWKLNEKSPPRKPKQDRQEDPMVEKMPNGQLRYTSIIPKGGNDGEIWRGKLWSQSANAPPSNATAAAARDDRPQSAAWGRGSCKSAGIPPTSEVYKKQRKPKKK